MEKNKTAIQELVEKLELEKSSQIKLGPISIYTAFIARIKGYQEKEKEQILEAYTQAGCDHGGDGEGAEDYYNEKYTQ